MTLTTTAAATFLFPPPPPFFFLIVKNRTYLYVITVLYLLLLERAKDRCRYHIYDDTHTAMYQLQYVTHSSLANSQI
jgi:hypothetical protein